MGLIWTGRGGPAILSAISNSSRENALGLKYFFLGILLGCVLFLLHKLNFHLKILFVCLFDYLVTPLMPNEYQTEQRLKGSRPHQVRPTESQKKRTPT